jgi:hypothetical protein
MDCKSLADGPFCHSADPQEWLQKNSAVQTTEISSPLTKVIDAQGMFNLLRSMDIQPGSHTALTMEIVEWAKGLEKHRKKVNKRVQRLERLYAAPREKLEYLSAARSDLASIMHLPGRKWPNKETRIIAEVINHLLEWLVSWNKTGPTQ